MNYLHTMIRVSNPDATIRFFELLGLREVRRMENEKGRFTLIFLAAPGDINGEGERAQAEVELGGEFPDDFSRRLDQRWRARLGDKRLYVNELFLTLIRRPLSFLPSRYVAFTAPLTALPLRSHW